MKKVGIYVHIPFCVQKCIYCDFISFSDKNMQQEKYVQSVIKEIENWKSQNKDILIDTIYIGGGTPSYLESENIIQIVNNLKEQITDDCEITIEMNPGTVTSKKLEDYKKVGINRLSIGLQSTNDDLLKTIGRIHNFQEFLETYQKARKVGFENINVDLMIGLPNQNIEDVKKSLEIVCNLEPEHVSVYSLIIEENTVMENLIKDKKLELPTEEQERNMYWFTKNFLELKGYKHYEISNFSKDGYESKHNMNCWEQREYRGFGIAAHSYINKTRFSNIENLEDYIQNVERGDFEKNIIIHENQQELEQEKEYMLLGLRKIEGVSITNFKNKFNENPIFLFRDELAKLCNYGLIMVNQDIIKLTRKGLDYANIVWEEFV